MRMFMSQKPSSVDLRVSDFKRVPGFNYVLPVLAEDEHTYDSLCSDIREAWSINASNGLQIYAFPEGTKDESATFVNTSRHEAKKGKKKLSPGVEVSRPGVEGVDRGQGSEKKDVS